MREIWIAKKENNMSEENNIPEMSKYEEISEFWDTHSLADYWDQTESADFELATDARRRYLVALDPQLLQRAQKLAQSRGLTTESLVNLLLEQRIHQLEGHAAQ